MSGGGPMVGDWRDRFRTAGMRNPERRVNYQRRLPDPVTAALLAIADEQWVDDGHTQRRYTEENGPEVKVGEIWYSPDGTELWAWDHNPNRRIA